jgi:3-isopropylmalate/(R)-2-methylmalate dehydratase small subunit
LFRRAAQPGYQLTVDLQSCRITDDAGLDLPFEVQEFRRNCLLHGLDDIGLTLKLADKISDYEARRGMAPISA